MLQTEIDEWQTAKEDARAARARKREKVGA